MPRAITHVVLAVLLLFAQHGALSHQVGHIQDRHPQHSQHQNDGKKSSAPELCVFHIAFGTVLGAIGSTALPPKFAANTAESSGSFIAHTFPHFAVVPASRDPPVLR
jgi:hypothetical protein